MSDFDKAYAFVLKWEGGRVDDPKDRGGRTNRGVTQLTYNAYRKEHDLPIRDVWEATMDETGDIYRKMFWDRAGCDKEEWPVNLALMDFAVHSGAVRAKQKIDEVRKPGMSQQELAEALIERRRLMLQRIIKANPSQKRFEKGWTNRVNDLEEACRA